jgi:predicted secreted hydrolase
MRWHGILFGLLLAGCAERGVPNAPQGLGIADVLGGAEDATEFARATEPPQLQFPRDHGAHPAFRTEWWYVTGNLDAADGHRFGVQLVFFRQALAPAGVPREAAMAAREMVLAHAAVTDVDGQIFHAEERLERLAAGLAEVRGPTEGEPFRIVCADWSARAAKVGDGFLPLDLHASGREFSFALRVEPGKPLVLQGDRGLSQKSEAAGNASIYYSMTRLPIAGTITSQGAQHEVRGECWIDREWSTSALGPQQVGWDWFSLQLDSGEELMWYRLRRRDGSVDPWSRGGLVDVAGNSTTLLPARVQTIPAGSWSAPDGGAIYPATWRLVGASPDFDLEITPLLANQELHTLVRYWEGAVAVRGTRDGKPVTGRGYLEMTGYARAR